MRRRQTFAEHEAARITRQANQALEARIRKLETGKRDRARDAFLDDMEASGRISADERATIERAYDASPEATVALISTRPAQRSSVGRASTAEETRAYADSAIDRLSIPKDRIV